jgi:hypothetical protein
MILYAANNQQLFLQSVNEQRNLGGLFSATAEWIRPVGSEELPTSIPTSLGEIEIFPEPVVSVGTDGFERITATGYDIWDQSTHQVINYTPGVITASIRSFVNPQTNEQNGQTFYDTITTTKTFEGYIFEVAHLKKMRAKGSQALPTAPILRVRDSLGAEITQFTVPINALSSYPSAQVQKTIRVTNINVNSYGSVEEVEVIYSITTALVSVSDATP